MTALDYSVADGVATLTLDRPARLNAFESELAHAWREATTRAVDDADVRAIVIQGSGPAFCAGGDVIAMGTEVASGADITGLARVINEGIRALATSSKPVVAAAHGTTAGGGIGILLSSDYAVVGETSKLGLRYSGVGLTPDLSVSAFLTRAVGERRALQLLLNDRMLTAAEAREWGLVAEVVVDDQVQARAAEIARSWASGPAAALGGAKRLVRDAPFRTLEEQLEEEALSIGAAFETEDAQARIRAFLEASRNRGR